MKTNKSFTKRLKITKNGKILGRKCRAGSFQCERKQEYPAQEKESYGIAFHVKKQGEILAWKVQINFNN